MAALGFTTIGFGVLLVWAGVKDEDLRRVLVDVVSGKRKLKRPAPPPAVATPAQALGADKKNMPQATGGGSAPSTPVPSL